MIEKTPYAYRQGVHGLGIGVGDLAFLRPQSLPLLTWTGGGQPVQRQLRTEQGQVFSPQTVTDVSLRGNGVYLSGQLALQALTDFKSKRDQS